MEVGLKAGMGQRPVREPAIHGIDDGAGCNLYGLTRREDLFQVEFKGNTKGASVDHNTERERREGPLLLHSQPV